MVVGIDAFKKWFQDYQGNYIIIGGSACDAVLSDSGFIPRATKDIDMILIVESLSESFVDRFWDFVRAAGYSRREQELEKRNAYRFLNPADPSFPKQVELFCRMPDVLTVPNDLHITPIPVEEGLSSLSAILLNDEYYYFTLQHSHLEDGIHYANIESLICLKTFAFLSNKDLKESGVNIHSVDIEKHKNDVFRLLPLLPSGNEIELPESIYADMRRFVAEVENNLPNQQMLKDTGYGRLTPESLFQNLKSIFRL